VKSLLHVLFALLLSALQAALLRWLGGGGFSLMLPVACVVYIALHAGTVEGALAAAGVGLGLDLALGTTRGVLTFLAVATFLMVRAVNAAVDVRDRWRFAALTAAATLIFSLGALTLYRIAAPLDVLPGIRLVPRVLLEAVLTGLASPLVLEAMKRIDGLFRREDPGLLR
jgi:rod shape-determining protein MreD